MYGMILHADLFIPEFVSIQATDILIKLLARDPKHRCVRMESYLTNENDINNNNNNTKKTGSEQVQKDQRKLLTISSSHQLTGTLCIVSKLHLRLLLLLLDRVM